MKKLFIYFIFFYFIFNIEGQGKDSLITLIECDYKTVTQLSENSEKHKGMKKFNRDPMPRPVKNLYYIDNDKSVLLDKNKDPTGIVLQFDDIKITTLSKNKLDRTKQSVQHLRRYVDIDRRTGELILELHTYDPTDVFHKDKILMWKYYGECKKIENTKKF